MKKCIKRTGGFRTIDAPNDELKTFMREISRTIIRDFKLIPHDSAYAYVKKRSVIDAVKEHQENKSRWFLKIDLKDFFGSCNEIFPDDQGRIFFDQRCHEDERCHVRWRQCPQDV